MTWWIRSTMFFAAVLIVAACAAGVPNPDPDPDPDPTPGPGPITDVGTWSTLPATGLDRQEVALSVVDGRFLLTGGGARQQRFDFESNVWSDVEPLPLWLDHVQAVAVGGFVFYVGGLTGWPQPHSSDVYAYDPQRDEFEMMAPMSRSGSDGGRGGGGAAAHEGRIYYAGGLHDGEAVAWFDVFDPATNAWTVLPDMPRARDHFHAAIVDGIFYAIGGRDTEINAVLPAVDTYDLRQGSSGAWTPLVTELPTPRGGFATAVLGREIFVIGGEGGGRTYDDVEVYDTVLGTWREATPMPTPRHGIQAAVCGGLVLIAAGGKTQGGASATDVVEVFQLDGAEPCVMEVDPVGTTTIDWKPGPAAPIGREEAQGGVVDGRLYITGGYIGWDPFCNVADEHSTYSLHKTAEGVWQWTSLAPLPQKLTHGGIVPGDGEFHLAGGRENEPNCDRTEQSVATVWTYDIATDAWHTPLPPLPAPRSSGGFVEFDGALHFFGGTEVVHPSLERGTHWKLVLEENGRPADGVGWVELAPMPLPRSHMAAVALGGFIYAIGGQTGEGTPNVPFSEVHRYDPIFDRWDEVAPLPDSVTHTVASVFVHQGRIVVLGGERGHSNAVSDVVAYDPWSNAWSLMTDLPQARRSGTAGIIDGQIVFTNGGLRFSADTYVGTFGD